MNRSYPLMEETYRILGACFEVSNEMGCGFLEPVYQECLGIELSLQQIPFEAQQAVRLTYKGQPLRKTYEPDFLCFRQIVVEVKAVAELISEHQAQVINYLHAAKLEVALLVNFGHYPDLQYQRIVCSRDYPRRASRKPAGSTRRSEPIGRTGSRTNADGRG